METKLRLEILAQWLQKVTTDDFYYDEKGKRRNYARDR